MVSTFDRLNDEQKIEALRLLCKTSVTLHMKTIAVLAKRGLIDLEDSENVLSTAIDLFDGLPEDMKAAFPPEMRKKIELARSEAASSLDDK